MKSYSTRNDALSKPTTLTLVADTLRIEVEGSTARSIPLSTVEELRLSFAPTGAEHARFRASLRAAREREIVFFNRRYRGLYDFEDTSAEYVAFLRELHLELAARAPACRFVAGCGGLRYLVNVLALAIAALAVLGAVVYFLIVGLVWLVLLKLVLIAFALPTALRWLARNKPRGYAPRAIPSDVLPG